jgi:hypothetical protein
MINQLFAYGPPAGTGGPATGGSPMSLIFMLLVIILPAIIICRRLAKEKGKNITTYTILAIIPAVNYFALLYLIGASNTMLEEKIDTILSFMKKQQGVGTEESKQE